MVISKWFFSLLAFVLCHAVTCAQGVFSVKYDKNPAVLTVNGLPDSIGAVRLSYQPLIGGKPVDVRAEVVDAQVAFSSDIRVSQTVSVFFELRWPQPSADGSVRPAALIRKPGEGFHAITVLLDPAETQVLTWNPAKKKSPAAWTAAGSKAAINADMANRFMEYMPRDLFRDINGMGLFQLRGKGIKEYYEKLTQIYNDKQAQLEAEKSVGNEFRQLVTANNQILYTLMLGAYEKLLNYANGQRGEYVLPADYFDYARGMDPLASPAANFSDFAATLNQTANSLGQLTGKKYAVVGGLEEVGRAAAYTTQIEDFRGLTEEQKSELSTAIPHFDDIIIQKHEDLLAQIEKNKNNSNFAILDIPKDVEGEDVFRAIVERYKGKPVLVDFWATWCGPCKSAMKTIIPVKEEMWDKCHFVYVTGETSPKATWNTQIPDIHGDHFYVTAKQWDTLLQQFDAKGIPTYVVVNARGQVQKRFIGFPGVDEMRDELKKAAK